MALFIAIWLLCGVLAAVIASSKNRNVGGWAICGIVFGVVAVVIIAVLPPEGKSKSITQNEIVGVEDDPSLTLRRKS